MNIRETLSCLSIIRAAARASGTGFFSIENTPVLPLSASAMETMVMGLSRVFDPAGLISRDAAMDIAVSVLKRKLEISSGSYSGIRCFKHCSLRILSRIFGYLAFPASLGRR